MYAKIQILGEIEVVTGMHIGGSSAFAAIGAVDSTIVKDIRTNLPMIPGSSLKGKMRALLAKAYNEKVVASVNDDNIRISRVFGMSKKDDIKPSRIIFSDMVMSNDRELRDAGLQSMTEVKFENTISRLTAVANPRQIERAVRGAKFDLDIVYEVVEEDEIIEDMELLAQGMKMLQYDYLGGNGSRGYGKVKFNNLEVEVVFGEVADEIIDECNKKFKEV